MGRLLFSISLTVLTMHRNIKLLFFLYFGHFWCSIFGAFDYRHSSHSGIPIFCYLTRRPRFGQLTIAWRVIFYNRCFCTQYPVLVGVLKVDFFFFWLLLIFVITKSKTPFLATYSYYRPFL